VISYYFSIHGVPNQCSGDVTTVMASFSKSQDHQEIADQFINAFLLDEQRAREDFPGIYREDEADIWTMDDAPEYAREVVGRSGTCNLVHNHIHCKVSTGDRCHVTSVVLKDSAI